MTRRREAGRREARIRSGKPEISKSQLGTFDVSCRPFWVRAIARRRRRRSSGELLCQRVMRGGLEQHTDRLRHRSLPTLDRFNRHHQQQFHSFRLCRCAWLVFVVAWTFPCCCTGKSGGPEVCDDDMTSTTCAYGSPPPDPILIPAPAPGRRVWGTRTRPTVKALNLLSCPLLSSPLLSSALLSSALLSSPLLCSPLLSSALLSSPPRPSPRLSAPLLLSPLSSPLLSHPLPRVCTSMRGHSDGKSVRLAPISVECSFSSTLPRGSSAEVRSIKASTAILGSVDVVISRCLVSGRVF